MFKKLLNKKLVKNEKGLTLIELLAVIVILAIVAAIAIPAIGNIINKSKDKAILAEASNVIAGAKIAYIDGACDGSPAAPCGGDALKPYVDGIDLTNISVTYDAETWSITHPDFTKIKIDAYKVESPATEKDINDRLKEAGVTGEGEGS